MEELMNKISIYHMLDYFVPGFILSFEIYHIIPDVLRHLLSGYTWILLVVFIVFSFIIGLVNNHISSELILIYADSNLEKGTKSAYLHLLVFIKKMVRKIANYRRKKLAMKMKSEFNVNVEEIEIEQIPDVEEEVIEVTIEEEDELFEYIKENYIPEIIQNSSKNDIYEYIYLSLQSKRVSTRLADFLTQKSLNRNLSSFCVASAVLSIFLSMQCNIFLSIIYKLILVAIFLLVGLVFYKEYSHCDRKIKKYMLMWFLQQYQK